MSRLKLNFLNTSSRMDEIKKYKRISLSAFGTLFLFSTYLVFQIFYSQQYMVNIYLDKSRIIGEKISRIEPRAKFLEKKINERNGLNKKMGIFLQKNDRVSAWVPRLMDLANLLPPDVIIKKIVYKKEKTPVTSPDLVVYGEHILQKDKQDFDILNMMTNTWENSFALSEIFQNIEILENNILKEGTDIKITFSIGFFRK